MIVRIGAVAVWTAVYFALNAVSSADAGPVPAPTDNVPVAQQENGGQNRSLLTAETITLPTGTAQSAEDKKPEVIEPQFVRPLVFVEPGRNDSNPVWSPLGTLISFERSIGDKKEIHVTLADGTPVQTLYFLLSESRRDTKFLFPGLTDETSYNAGLSWSPDEFRFVFMSNGGEGNYDIYVQDLGGTAPLRLTDHREKDGQASWSPAADSIVFVSGRTGKGDLYSMDLKTRTLSRLTQGGNAYLFPRWSPDGRRLAATYGNNENHDIVVINDPANPVETRKWLTTWQYDDLRPAWSPDGKKLAFYSNENAAEDPRVWSLFVIAADGTDPTTGEGLAAKAVARDILPDIESGPAWMPDSTRLVFVKNERQEYNPIYITDINNRIAALIRTDTKMNHDVAIAADGSIAFRAQVNQWDQIFVMKLKN